MTRMSTLFSLIVVAVLAFAGAVWLVSWREAPNTAIDADQYRSPTGPVPAAPQRDGAS